MKTIPVKKLGTAEVIVDIVPKGNFEIRPAYPMNPSQITVHNTGNAGRGAGAEAHRRYLHNMADLTPRDTGYASYHFVLDGEKIVQLLPLDESAWHCGDGSGTTSGNRTAIGIEICENPETDTAKAEANAIALIVYLMEQLKIPASKVKPHQAFSGKFCPRVILKRDGGFEKFRSRIVSAYNNKDSKASVAYVPSKSFAGKRLESIYKGSEGLNFYSKASFDAKYKVGVVPYGVGFPTVLDKVKVDGAYMYKVQNSKGAEFYITASDQFVKLEGVVEKPAYVVVEVTADVWLHSKPDYSNSTRVRVLKKGEKYRKYGEVNGMANLGNSYASLKYLK